MSPDTEGGTPAVAPPPKRRRRRRYALVILALLVLVGVLGGIKFAQIKSLIGFGKKAAIAGPPPEAVSTDVAQASAWEANRVAVGSISGVRSVAVSNDSPGIVLRIGFESGDIVKRGQLLLELDASPEKAQVEAAKAKLSHAEATVRRSRILEQKDALTGEQLDVDETAYKSAVAEVEAAKAAIDRKVVRAPFSGRLGIRAVNLGQYLNPGTQITSLDSLEGAFVDFTLPQAELANLRTGMPVRLAVQGSKEPFDGSILAIDPTVDSASRNVRVRASAVDPRGRLRPGMFVEVTVVLPHRAPTVSVPATAIVHASYGDSVFVVEPKLPGSPGMATTPDGKPVKVARQQFVRVGTARGDFVSVAEGLTAGQTVVSAGGFKLHNGSPVVVDNRVKAEARLSPHPENR